jgi:hypothetical protein
MRITQRPLRRWWPAAVIAVLLAALTYTAATVLRRGTAVPDRAPTFTAGPQARAREQARQLLDRADTNCRRALAEQLDGLDRFFRDARGRAPAFVDNVLGWEARWLLATDQLRGGAGRYLAFARRAFAAALFTPDELDRRAAAAVAGYLDAVDAVEAELPAAIRAASADVPTTLPVATLDGSALRAACGRAAAEAERHARAGVMPDVARELAALAVGEALTQLVLQLGVAAGMPVAGAPSAATLGLGLIVGLAVEHMTGAWDGRAALAREVARGVDRLRALVIEGTPQAPGLRPRLERLDRERAARRRAAVLGRADVKGGSP